MISIRTSINNQSVISDYINSIDRLNELVIIETNVDSQNSTLLVLENNIQSTIDWFDSQPPYLLPHADLTKENLLGLVFYKLGNHQRAFEFINSENELYSDLLIATSLQFGYEISTQQIEFLKNSSPHNYAIVLNYGNIGSSVLPDEVQRAYENALKIESENSIKLFSAKHYVNFLMDSGLEVDAEKLIRSVAEKATSKNEKQAFNVLLANSLKSQLKIPYDFDHLAIIIKLQESCINYFEDIGLSVNAALMLVDASEIANLKNDFGKSNDFINKAILYLKEAEIEEFLGEATLQKAALLYSWSKNGSPQYYKPAINSYQNALKVFKRDTYPQKFADIHHNLALIYSEIKVSENEKPIWTAFCASSFKDALKFYSQEHYPYEFAMISHNYATALMGFPEAKLHNNLDKAMGMFNEALLIRTIEQYPFERALTLLNQLELFWLIHNEDKEEEHNTFNEMLDKANQIKELVSDVDLIEKAKTHITALAKLKPILN